MGVADEPEAWVLSQGVPPAPHATHYTLPRGTKLDLGSGPRPLEGYRGVDIVPGITDYELDFDTGMPWPFEDDSVAALRASHVIEHIAAGYRYEWQKVGPAGCLPKGRGGPHWIERGGWTWKQTTRKKDLLFHFFDEAWRCAEPGASFEVRFPNVKNELAYGDPTHRRFISTWLLPYLNRKSRELNGVGHYVAECNWDGSVHEERSHGLARAVELSGDELGAAAVREWNVCDETVLLLRADKS